MKLREEEFYEQYHQHGGTTIIPTEIFNELYDDATEEIERLNKQLQLISDEFLKYDWENSSKEQIINQLKSLYNSIFKGSDKE